MNKKIKFEQWLLKVNACHDAQLFCKGKTPQQAWNQCKRADWLLWWMVQVNVDIKILTLCRARCAKTVMHLLNNEKGKKLILAAELYGLKKISLSKFKQCVFSDREIRFALVAYGTIQYFSQRNALNYIQVNNTTEQKAALAAAVCIYEEGGYRYQSTLSAYASAAAVGLNSKDYLIGFTKHQKKMANIIRKTFKPNFII
ncbi:MAG: hypothetical protein IPO78_17165 [Saprospiraceae bacterium]|nr:hypothetical protein [Saprospiraceae bacterium]